MGLDGGTIITRSDVLRGTSWRLANSGAGGGTSTRGGAVSTREVYQPPSLDRQTEWRIKWGTCALSEQPLAAPVVADHLGSLYNREAVLEWLLARRGAPADESAVHRFANQIRVNGAAREHLASMRDVFPVDLAAGGGAGAAGYAAGASGSGAGGSGEQAAGAPPLYSCPVTGLPAGRYAMVALVPCGHIVSQRALDAISAGAPPAAAASGGRATGEGGGGAAAGKAAAVGSGGSASGECQCPVCGKGFVNGQDDVVINGGAEQVAALRRRLEERKAKGGGGAKRKRDKQEQQAAAAGQQSQAGAGQDEAHGAGGEAGGGGGGRLGGAAAEPAEGSSPVERAEPAIGAATGAGGKAATPPPPGTKRVRIAGAAGGT